MSGLALCDLDKCAECGRTDKDIALRDPRLCINCYRRRLRAEGRLNEKNRRVGLRRAQKQAADYLDCPSCDGKMSRGHQRCGACREKFSREREARFIALRREGLNNQQIAGQEGVTIAAVAKVLSRAKSRGVGVGPSPYWLRNQRELAHA